LEEIEEEKENEREQKVPMKREKTRGSREDECVPYKACLKAAIQSEVPVGRDG
jgi:hypothetical protein